MGGGAVVFDLDGTLVDTAPDLWRATNHVLTSYGRRGVTLAEVRDFVGHGARALISRGLKATGEAGDRPTVEALYADFVSHYGEHIAEGSQPVPGTVALLDELKAEGYSLGVCTNKLERLSVKLLETLGLAKYFDAVIGPDTVGIAKPDPAIYHETLSRMPIIVERSVMIGDSETDVLTARAAGVPVIGVTFGYTPRPLAEFEPDHLVSDFAHALPAIKQAIADQRPAARDRRPLFKADALGGSAE
jgi:phosphoglycolate phosphatase